MTEHNAPQPPAVTPIRRPDVPASDPDEELPPHLVEFFSAWEERRAKEHSTAARPPALTFAEADARWGLRIGDDGLPRRAHDPADNEQGG